MEAHQCHHKVSFSPLQCFLAKSKDKIPKKCLQKETKLLYKIIPECTKSNCLFQKFPGGGMPLHPPTMARAFGARIRAFGAKFLPHQPRIHGYVSELYTETIMLCPLNVYVCQFQMDERISLKFITLLTLII